MKLYYYEKLFQYKMEKFIAIGFWENAFAIIVII